MSNATSYPTPALTETNRPLLESWREGRLMLQHCTDCGHTFFFPRPFCPGCWSADLQWREHSGRATVVAFTRIHRHVHESFRAEIPTVLAEIALEAGPSMLARCVPSDELRVGGSVRLVGAADAQRYPLPTFACD